MRKTIRLDQRYHSKRSIMRKLARELEFPNHFGANFDALFDCLSCDVEGPLQIVWKADKDLRKSLGKDFHVFCTIFEEIERERDDFRFVLY